MSYFVDTHVLLWSLIEPARLERRTRAVLQRSDAVKCVSVITFWEISLKYSLGRITLEGATPDEVLQAANESGYQIEPVDPAVVASSYRLPLAAGHKDPFDRLLIWQCIQAGFTMVTADKRFKGYERHGLKLL